MAATIEVKVLKRVYWCAALAVVTGVCSLVFNYHYSQATALLGMLPLLLIAARMEKFVFDERMLSRRGPLAFLESLITGRRQSMPLDDIEMIATEAIRSRRGLHQVKYFYRVSIAGNNIIFSMLLAGGARNGDHELVKRLFNAVSDNKIDPRSSELKQYLNDQQPKEQRLDIARRLDFDGTNLELFQHFSTSLLRQVANSLKLEGCMQQAMRCFSLAYKLDPRNAQLLYEMARFFRSLAMIDNPRLLSRSRACLRLAAFIGKDEPRLLERIGETYFERLEYRLAARCFSRALVIEPGLYRANIGMAEIALRDGKLAHVAHYYSAAATASHDRAQRDLASREARYYGRLCSDDDYFEAEINRITKLRNVEWARHLSAILLFVFWVFALLSGRFSQDLGKLAWSAVISTSLVWLGSVLLSLHYRERHQ
jgi:tetratricopeptide (TPR) repeat protein